MNYKKLIEFKKLSSYILIVLLIACAAFILDILSARLTVEIGPKSIIDGNGQIITTVEVVYPIWHQIINLLKNFLYGLAAAIFITVFIANKLERSQQEEKKEELQKLSDAVNINVFDSLFKTIIPEEIFKIIKQDIIENKVVRREAKWVYNFSEVGDSLLCTQTTRYELHNLSQAPVSNPIELELHSLDGKEYKIISAECLDRAGVRSVNYDPLNENNNKNITVKKSDRKITVAYTVSIPPENYVEYKTVFEKTYSGDIIDAQGTRVPVIGADIIVNFPEGYEFDVSPMMSSKPRLITESITQKIYRVEGGILPNQGFVYYLAKKTNNI